MGATREAIAGLVDFVAALANDRFALDTCRDCVKPGEAIPPSCIHVRASDLLARWNARGQLREDADAIVKAADALRISEGRGRWSTDDLPGKDVRRAVEILTALDAVLFAAPTPDTHPATTKGGR